MRAVIEPGVAFGVISAPPSKSYSHRALIAAGLANGESRIHGVLDSEDISATTDCLKLLGVKVVSDGADRLIQGMPGKTEHMFDGEKNKEMPLIVPCRESGSTMRFFIPLFLLTNRLVEFQGYGRLMERPMKIYEDICSEQGLLFQRTETGIRVKGTLHAGTFRVPGNISSQFITGLLFALPLLSEESRIELIPPVESRSYIRITLEVLRDFGIAVREEGNTLVIPGAQQYQPREYMVEGDYSNAAFLDALGLVSELAEANQEAHTQEKERLVPKEDVQGKKSPVCVTGLKENSLQGDKVYRKYLAMLKAGEDSIDLQDCPDLGPVLMAVAAVFHGGRFVNTSRLKIKESDRGQVMAEELRKFGVFVRCMENEILVEKGTLRKPKTVLNGHNDHRIAMALSVLCTLTGGSIEGAECVKKSYPGFFEDMKKLGIGVELIWQ